MDTIIPVSRYYFADTDTFTTCPICHNSGQILMTYENPMGYTEFCCRSCGHVLYRY